MVATHSSSTPDNELNNVTLVIMAAGLGRRFGGDKQLANLGPQGETMLELSLASAIKAGCSAAVIITRAELIEPLQQRLTALPDGFALHFCVQQTDDLPAECLPLQGEAKRRGKPWGTAHALWCARHWVNGSMIVINADDYYGDNAFKLLVDGFKHASERWQIVAYGLNETLSQHGGVNRGICQTQGDYLSSVQEWLDIAWQGDKLLGHNGQQQAELDPHSLVSMTCWGFSVDIFRVLELALIHFIKDCGHLAGSECYLPAVVQTCLPSQHQQDHNISVKPVYVNISPDTWMGVTYPQDALWVKQKLMELLGD
ncbi:NTP transferase domain-containing protein [Shewanella algidipiscicola]|uniref:MobA-like NTP transferase domain-containing protein n=1 Tax=Shewanella algidipiscicola TaxID=614070 RepID=A0ABQ4PG24_9GAMM|nr:NTP transferase domain-containing protein [Shewanella algidipiscicola]GIU46456.1 hypothetical protein TUM4630_16990 [Shewanella algidipiscicola]